MTIITPRIYAKPIIYDQNHALITVSKNQTEFDIKLNANPTTGYSWQLCEFDQTKITPLTHHYIAPNTKLVGAPGYELWSFRAKSAALTSASLTDIKFQYVRPWEPKNVVKSAKFAVIAK